MHSTGSLLPFPTPGRRARRIVATLISVLLLAGACSGSDPVADSPSAGSPSAVPDPATSPDPAVDPDPASSAEPAPDPASSPEPAGPPPTPEPPAPPAGRCREADVPGARFDVVDVAVDDPDGGLVVHTEPGVDTPVSGVLPWYARGIGWTGQCELVANGAEWWAVSSNGVFGWVNARYLGDRPVEGESIAASPCTSSNGTDLPADQAGGSSADFGEAFAVTDIRVESTPACDRVVIELGTGWDFEAIPEPLDAFPIDAVTAITFSGEELQVSLNPVFATAFDSIPPVVTWRDVATGEQNVALVLDRDGRTEIHLGWGTGVAAVSYASFPARIIVDIAQKATPEGELAGPIAADGGLGPILFEPISRRLDGDGVTLPITVRGWSRGFESVSVLDVRSWSGTYADHPGAWNGRLFGEPESSASAERPPSLVLEPPAPDWADPDRSTVPISTTGHFSITITALEPGAYQLAVTPSTGLGCADSVGQQFRVAGGAQVEPGAAPMVPFSLGRERIDETASDLTAVTTIDVLGVEYVVEGPC